MADNTVVVGRVRGIRGLLQGICTQPIPPHTGIYRLHLQARATLDRGHLGQSVLLPEGADRNTWIAAHTLYFFKAIVETINVLETLCSESTCPRMSAGKHVMYSWAEDVNQEAQALPAREYMKNLAFYAESKLKDTRLFPVDGPPLHPEFMKEVATMCRRFFRVYAHAYLSHFQDFQNSGAEAELNCLFKHFLYFVLEFGLVDKKDTQPLAELIKRFLIADEKKYGKNDNRPGFQ